jgi:RimJ/RimL family protein N-acetyltransferase
MMPDFNPVLLNLPEQLETARLILRPPRPGDGIAIQEAVLESINDLSIWMPWAAKTPTLEDTETWCRNAHARFTTRTDLPLICILKENGTFAGGTGLHRINWKVPSVEIGYWIRTSLVGKGYVTESTRVITEFAFDCLKARRVEIRMDDRNIRSWRVAERLGFILEGILHYNGRDNLGELENTRVYAKVR